MYLSLISYMTTAAPIVGELEITNNIIEVPSPDRISSWSNNTRACVYIWTLDITYLTKWFLSLFNCTNIIYLLQWSLKAILWKTVCYVFALSFHQQLCSVYQVYETLNCVSICSCQHSLKDQLNCTSTSWEELKLQIIGWHCIDI